MKKTYSRDQLSHARVDSMPFFEATLNAVVDGSRQRGWPATRRGRMDQFGEQQRPGLPRHPVITGYRFQNGSGSTVPPFGVVIVETGSLYSGDASSPDATVIAAQPSVYGSQYQAFVNGQDPVAVGDFGYCRRQPKMLAAYDPSGGAPTVGSVLGPRAGSFLLTMNTGGFRCVGLPTNMPSGLNLVWVEPLPMLTLRGKTTGLISANSADTSGITVYWGSVNTGVVLTGAYNDSPTQIPSGQTVILTYSPDVVDGSLSTVPWRVTPWGMTMLTATSTSTVFAPNTGSFTPAGGGSPVTATVPHGMAVANKAYQIEMDQQGNYFVLDADQVATGSCGSTIVAGSSGSFICGSSACTITATVPQGVALANNNYLIVADKANNWYVANPTLTVAAVVGATNTATVAGNTASALLYAGAIGSEVSTGVTVTAYVREGVAVNQTPTRMYVLEWVSGGWEVADPDLICLAQFPAVGSVTAFAAGAGAGATIYVGTQGSETPTATTGVTAFIRDGVCMTGNTYKLGWTPSGWEVLDPEDQWLVQLVASQPTDGSAAARNFIVFTGTVDTEVTTNLQISANVRVGVCLPSTTYLCCNVDNRRGAYEIVNPDLEVFGQVTADVAADATGTLTIYTGTGAGTASTTTLTPVRNDTSCTVKAGKLTYARHRRAGNAWVFDVFHSS